MSPPPEQSALVQPDSLQVMSDLEKFTWLTKLRTVFEEGRTWCEKGRTLFEEGLATVNTQLQSNPLALAEKIPDPSNNVSLQGQSAGRNEQRPLRRKIRVQDDPDADYKVRGHKLQTTEKTRTQPRRSTRPNSYVDSLDKIEDHEEHDVDIGTF